MQRISTLRFILATLLMLCSSAIRAQNTGTISGKIIDEHTKAPLIGASIVVKNTDDFLGTITDTSGTFVLNDVPFGVYTLQISYIGYNGTDVADVAVYHQKGAYVAISLVPSTHHLGEVNITAYSDPVESTDPMAMTSARSISIEETKRFAGSLGDPSRMALSYAGVNSGRGDNNDIIIRGNSAKYLQWKLEGLEIPNPNHFGVYGSSGGLLNILNGSNLGRSDFYLGAMPAHTGNALAGMFDLSLRNGNSTTKKHSVETSLIGLSASSEGPLKKGNYAVNYRYSTLGLMKQLGVFYQAPEYQDLTFKLNLPTKGKGTFTVYGLAGLGNWLEEDFYRKIDSSHYTIGSSGDTLFGYDEIVAENLNRYNIAVAGAKYTKQLGAKSTLINHVNYSVIYSAPRSSDINRDDFSIYQKSEGHFTNSTFRYKPELITYINQNSTLHTGAILSFRAFQSELIEGFPDHTSKTIVESTDRTFLGQSFVAYKNTAIEKLEFVLGAHYTYFNLNEQHIIEPRVGAKLQLSSLSSLAFASGLHSTTESPEVYLVFTDSAEIQSRDLKMSRSWQTVLSYKKQLAEELFLTAELYSQYLFDVPIAADSSNFSLINEDVSFTDVALVNEGQGLNYGLEITLEKFFANSYYFLATASLFQSEYRLMERHYRKTKFSNSYVFNLLAGKEFKIKKNKFLAINIRGNFSGGKPYVPVLLEESVAANQEVRDEDEAYANTLPPYIGIDFSMSYRWVKPRVSHEVKLDLFRAYEQNYYDEVYQPERLNFDGSVTPASVKQVQYGEGQTSTTFLPVLYYRLSF